MPAPAPLEVPDGMSSEALAVEGLLPEANATGWRTSLGKLAALCGGRLKKDGRRESFPLTA